MLRDAHYVAERLNVPVQRVWGMCRSGVIPLGVVVRFGPRQIRFNEDRLEEWIAAGGNAADRPIDSDNRGDAAGGWPRARR